MSPDINDLLVSWSDDVTNHKHHSTRIQIQVNLDTSHWSVLLKKTSCLPYWNLHCLAISCYELKSRIYSVLFVYVRFHLVSVGNFCLYCTIVCSFIDGFTFPLVFISISEHFNFILLTQQGIRIRTGLVIGKLVLFVLFYPLIFYLLQAKRDCVSLCLNKNCMPLDISLNCFEPFQEGSALPLPKDHQQWILMKMFAWSINRIRVWPISNIHGYRIHILGCGVFRSCTFFSKHVFIKISLYCIFKTMIRKWKTSFF